MVLGELEEFAGPLHKDYEIGVREVYAGVRVVNVAEVAGVGHLDQQRADSKREGEDEWPEERRRSDRGRVVELAHMPAGRYYSVLVHNYGAK